MTTATILDLTVAYDGTLLVTAECQACRKTVMPGAGATPEDLLLGHRRAHCGCVDYSIADTDGILPGLLPAIRAEVARRTERQARRAARRR